MSASKTLRDLAKIARVHHSTLSRALHNDARLPAKTREKLQDLAEKHGYRHDAMISRHMAYLRQRRLDKESPVLALITAFRKPSPWKWIGPAAAFYKNVTSYAAKLGYRIEEFWLTEPGMTQRRMAKILKARGIEGVIFHPSGDIGRHLSMDLSAFCVACFPDDIWRPRLHGAETYHYHNALLALKKIKRKGYQRIGLVSPKPFLEHASEAAYYFASQTGRIPQFLPPFVNNSWSSAGFLPWLKKNKPDVILSTFIDVRDWLKEAGWKIPNDIGFAVLGDAEQGKVAGINGRPDLVDTALVDLVVWQIQTGIRGAPENARRIYIEGDWVDGPTLKSKT